MPGTELVGILMVASMLGIGLGAIAAASLFLSNSTSLPMGFGLTATLIGAIVVVLTLWVISFDLSRFDPFTHGKARAIGLLLAPLALGASSMIIALCRKRHSSTNSQRVSTSKIKHSGGEENGGGKRVTGFRVRPTDPRNSH